ncbi:hypothetical protein KIS4809_3533 [Bacillus sp. ZZV12-4809]|nr:hypothetical protein KIS4809_3533 [Bacillus sp. ZZV12-4809]
MNSLVSEETWKEIAKINPKIRAISFIYRFISLSYFGRAR